MNFFLWKWLGPLWGFLFLCSSSLASEGVPPDPESPGPDLPSYRYDAIAAQSPLEGEEASADAPPSRTHPRKQFGAGAMVMGASNPYRGGETVVLVLPMLTYLGERFFVVTPRAGYNLARPSWGSINLIADYRFKSEAFEAEGYLAGMEDREDAVMAGLGATLRMFGHYRWELSAMTDVLNRHKGEDVNLALNRSIRWGRWGLVPGAGLVWRSADYNDYYYGVSPAEATEARPAYAAGDSLEWFVRLLLRYHLTADWSLTGTARLEELSNELRDSPIVDSEYLTTVFLGLNYSF